MSNQRNDAPESLFFARDLEYQETKIYQTDYPAFKFREIFPVNNEGGEFITTISYKMYDRSGMAKVLSDYATDWPVVNLNATETRVPVKAIGDAALFSEDELGAAQKTGVPLESESIVQMRRGYEEKCDRVADAGDPTGLMGWNSNPYIPIATPTTSSGAGDDTWPNKTPDEILADLRLLYSTIVANTKGTHIPNTLIISAERALFLRQSRLSATNATLLSFIQAAFPGMQIVEWQRMTTAAVGGAQRCSMLERTPEVVEFKEPMPFKLYPLEKIPGTLTYKYLGRGKVGGVVMRKPLAACHMDGI